MSLVYSLAKIGWAIHPAGVSLNTLAGCLGISLEVNGV
jgi:hypothetical protein